MFNCVLQHSEPCWTTMRWSVVWQNKSRMRRRQKTVPLSTPSWKPTWWKNVTGLSSTHIL